MHTWGLTGQMGFALLCKEPHWGWGLLGCRWRGGLSCCYNLCAVRRTVRQQGSGRCPSLACCPQLVDSVGVQQQQQQQQQQQRGPCCSAQQVTLVICSALAVQLLWHRHGCLCQSTNSRALTWARQPAELLLVVASATIMCACLVCVHLHTRIDWPSETACSINIL